MYWKLHIFICIVLLYKQEHVLLFIGIYWEKTTELYDSCKVRQTMILVYISLPLCMRMQSKFFRLLYDFYSVDMHTLIIGRICGHWPWLWAIVEYYHNLAWSTIHFQTYTFCNICFSVYNEVAIPIVSKVDDSWTIVKVDLLHTY